MNIEQKKEYLIDRAYWAVRIGIAVLILIICRFMGSYVMPLIVGVIISAMVQRPARFISKKTKTPKAACSVALVLLIFAGLIALGVFFLIELYHQGQSFSKILPEYLPKLSGIFSTTDSPFIPFLEGIPDDLIEKLNAMPGEIIGSLSKTLTTWLGSFAGNVASATPAAIATIVVSIIASCYIAKDYTVIRAFFGKQIPAKHLPIVRDVKKLFSDNLLKVGRGYLILMAITFVELACGLLIFRVRLAIPIAALIAVVDIFPVLGTGTVLIPWALIQLLSGNYPFAIGLIVMYLIISILRSFLEPKIISKQIGMPPLVTLLAIYVGFKLLGFVGMIGLPLVLIVIMALQEDGKINIWKNLNEKEIADAKKL